MKKTCDGEAKTVQTLDEVKNSDFTAPRNEYHFRTPFLTKALMGQLKDKRDEPMVCLQLNILQYVIPGISLVYYVNLNDFSVFAKNMVGLVYVVLLAVLFFERFILMLHFSSHRAIYHSEALNLLPNWVFAPIFGVPSGVYKLHHVIMHHIENNHDLDISSTEFYQRDSWLGFLGYWLRFTFLIWLELPAYAFRTKRYQHFQGIVGGMAVWLGTAYVLSSCVSFRATMWVLVVPHYVAMSAMSFGNWSQHILVDPKQPDSNYALTYNCLDSPTNRTTFNDGYHIIHHANARLHWSEMPQAFYDSREKHLNSGAMTFRGVHFFDVGILVMTKQLRKLAEHYVHLGTKDTAPTVQAVEEMLRERLKPMAPVPSQSSKKKS